MFRSVNSCAYGENVAFLWVSRMDFGLCFRYFSYAVCFESSRISRIAAPSLLSVIVCWQPRKLWNTFSSIFQWFLLNKW